MDNNASLKAPNLWIRERATRQRLEGGCRENASCKLIISWHNENELNDVCSQDIGTATKPRAEVDSLATLTYLTLPV